MSLLQSRAQSLSADPSRDQGRRRVSCSDQPGKPDDTVSTAEKNALDFEVLSDAGQKVGRAFGLVYTFSDELISTYKQFGQDIPGRNGSGEWALPISATYVIGQDGQIIYAHKDADYRDRAEPAEVLQVLKKTAVNA
ncbi:MAG: hypothetical protein WBE48_00605 [Xanthobacteraceae bacterium]